MAKGTATADYNFHLPPGLIAQEPAGARDESRLMVIDRLRGTIDHARFRDLEWLIPSDDLLVVNRSRVLRARLLGRRASGGAAEVFLLRKVGDSDELWEAMVHPGGKLHPGRRVEVAAGFSVLIESITDRRTRIVRLESPDPSASVERYGHVPLPPYIRRADSERDAESYQTVYAREAGSVAAPTAGLHFTREMLGRLINRGVKRAEVLLHVGAGTFRPVEVEDPEDHRMHSEYWSLDDAAARLLNETRERGSAIWAVGSTAVRTLESAVLPDGTFRPTEGETAIFIRPPYRWRAVDHLITNFHLPRSTLIMLVAAFAGHDLTMEAYRRAVDERYRFYSYGDAMVII
ncbi:MAG: tRNA preQ1(34) S-adenosylmethionine ribosyltransferase-isomerase QueA [Gemmatimonadota bacterium]